MLAQGKHDPVGIKSPINPDMQITFQDFQEFKLAIYTILIVFLVNMIVALGKMMFKIFSKKGENTEALLQQLLDNDQEIMGDIREIKTDLRNRPTHDDVIKKIYDYGTR